MFIYKTHFKSINSILNNDIINKVFYKNQKENFINFVLNTNNIIDNKDIFAQKIENIEWKINENKYFVFIQTNKQLTYKEALFLNEWIYNQNIQIINNYFEQEYLYWYPDINDCEERKIIMTSFNFKTDKYKIELGD